MDKYPVSVLSSHIEMGDLSLADCYPQIIEHGTEQNKHEVPRIVFRACLPSRLKDGEIFNFVSVNFTSETVDNTKAKLEEMELIPNSLYYIYVGQYKTLKTPVKTAFTKRGFTPNDIVNKFFDGRIEKQEYKNEGDFIQSYYDEENKIAVVVGSIVSEYFWNVCAAVCPRIIPWYFNVRPDFTLENHPLTEEERALVRAIDVGDTEFIAAAQVIYDKTDVALRVQAVKFKNMYRSVRTKMIAGYQKNIEDLNSKFAQYQREIEDTIKRIRDASMLKSALENGADDDGSKLSEMFSGRSNIAIRNWSGDDLIFTGSAIMGAYEADPSATISRSGHSLYNGLGSKLAFDKAKRLMEAVFVDRIIQIPVYANFRFSLANTSLKVETGLDPAPKFAHCIPQPHHEHYNCTGSNLSVANDYMKDGKYDSAIAQMVGSLTTLNLGDSTVTSYFAGNYLWDKNKTPFMLPDGKKVNFIDADKWLEKEGE